MEKNNGFTIEQMFEQLDSLIADMETESSLEETFQKYHKGMQLLKECDQKIEKIEKQILVLDQEGNTHEF